MTTLKQLRSAVIAALASLLMWGAAWAALDRELHAWSYSCSTDQECEDEDAVRNAAEGSIR